MICTDFIFTSPFFWLNNLALALNLDILLIYVHVEVQIMAWKNVLPNHPFGFSNLVLIVFRYFRYFFFGNVLILSLCKQCV